MTEPVAKVDTTAAVSPSQLLAGRSNTNNKWRHRFLHMAIHWGLCAGIYLYPIWDAAYNDPYVGPTLDEIHILGRDHPDVVGTSTVFWDVFQHDYWGRSMNFEWSHKSWRPLTILTFRYLPKTLTENPADNLHWHRTVSALTHAAAADLVGQLAAHLMVQSSSFPSSSFWVHVLVKIAFVLHPTHVEVTANVANRNHMLAVALSVALILLLLRRRSYAACMATLVAGYLCSETFLFQIPAVVVTTMGLEHLRRLQESSSTKPFAFVGGWMQVVKDYWRIAFLCFASGCLYVGIRFYFHAFDIPDALIRPAENPFFRFTGQNRLVNYFHVLAIHAAKTVYFLDPIGFSHEYGFDCVPQIVLDAKNVDLVQEILPLVGLWARILLAWIALIAAATWAMGVLCPSRDAGNRHSSSYYVSTFGTLWLIHISWMVSLFPVSGILKVGTFVADRMAVPASTAVSLWTGILLAGLLTKPPPAIPRPLLGLVVAWLLGFSAHTIVERTRDWMNPVRLMQSSLVSCPRFAKAHMETSKLYSGMFPDLVDFEKALYHLRIAHSIDNTTLCDVHYQFAHVYVQQGQWLDYERELVDAIQCPFTMQQALPQWQQYWQVIHNNLDTMKSRIPPHQYESSKQELHDRQARYTEILREAALQQQRREEEAKKQELSGGGGK